jgi:hypothetical protein
MAAGANDSRLLRKADLILIVLGALILGSAAFIHQRVSIFHDSGTYFLYGQHILSELRAIAELNRGVVLPLAGEDPDYYGARSPTYSLLLYLATSLFSLWGVLAFQALTASWLLLTLTKAARPNGYAKPFVALVVTVTLASGLSYFVSFAMPDVFAGLGALALVGYLAFSDRLGRNASIGLLLAIAAAASFHPTIAPMQIAAAIAGGVAALLCGQSARRTAAICGAAALAIIVGVATGPLYRAIERQVFDHRIEAPPFVMARLLEDGTGVRYLAQRCASGAPLALCQVPLRPPINSDTFLWERGEEGGYLALPVPQRAALRAEQWRFVIGTILSRPGEQLAISLDNWQRQLLMNDVIEPTDDPRTQASYDLFEQTGSRPGVAMHFRWEPVLAALRTGILLLSTGALLGYGFAAATVRMDVDNRRTIMIAVAVVFVAVVANAAICGIVSKPYARYQARISWLIPTIVLLLSIRLVNAEHLRHLLKQVRTGSRL